MTHPTNPPGDGGALTPRCAAVPWSDAEAIFFPVTPAGLPVRTSPWPAPDRHEQARRLCGSCPVIGDCLRGALEQDEVAFRALAAEERAVFGGVRDKDTRKRPVRLTAAQVIHRLIGSGYDMEPVIAALADWDAHLIEHPHLAGEGCHPYVPGWSSAYRAGLADTDETVDLLVTGSRAGTGHVRLRSKSA